MENITLCGASWYEQKYYFNPAFDKLPKSVKDELQIMCVEFTEDVGVVLTLEFEEDKMPHFTVRHIAVTVIEIVLILALIVAALVVMFLIIRSFIMDILGKRVEPEVIPDRIKIKRK